MCDGVLTQTLISSGCISVACAHHKLLSKLSPYTPFHVHLIKLPSINVSILFPCDEGTEREREEGGGG